MSSSTNSPDEETKKFTGTLFVVEVGESIVGLSFSRYSNAPFSAPITRWDDVFYSFIGRLGGHSLTHSFLLLSFFPSSTLFVLRHRTTALHSPPSTSTSTSSFLFQAS
jgi:hypothetical protein